MAGATDYHVPPSSGQGFADALQKAEANPGLDRIFLGAGYYTAPVSTGFQYSGASDPVEIIGAGRDLPSGTIVNGQNGGSFRTLGLWGGPGTSIHDLRIDLPIGAASGAVGLQTSAFVHDVTVLAKDVQQSNFRDGIVLTAGGTVEGSIVDIGVQQGTGILLDNGGGTVRRCSVTGDSAMVSSSGGLIEQSSLHGRTRGLVAYRNQTTVRNSSIRVSDPLGWAINAFGSPGSDNTIVADGVNVLGPGGPSAIGVVSDDGNAPSQKIAVTLTNSLVRGFATPLKTQGGTRITASYSDYDGSGNNDFANPKVLTESNISNVGDAGFDASGDYRPIAGSALIDAGDPAEGQGLDDLLGNALVTDGNQDGFARREGDRALVARLCNA